MRTTMAASVLTLINLVAVQSMFGQGNATLFGVVSDSTRASVAGVRIPGQGERDSGGNVKNVPERR